VAEPAGFTIHQSRPANDSMQLNKVLFGAEIGPAHADWYGSGETYSFYVLKL